MAVETAKLVRRRVFAAAVETTTGTAESLVAADGDMHIFDPDMQPDVPFNQRKGQGTASMLPGVPGLRSGTVSMQSEVYGLGSAAAPLWATTLLAACGFQDNSGVLTPLTGTTGMTTLTLGSYEDGRLRTLFGAVGDLTMTFTAGEAVKCDWNFTGKFGLPSDASLVSPTYPTLIPPRFAAATLTIGGSSYKVNEVVIAFNNVVTPRQDATDLTGLHSYIVSDRNITVTVDPEADALATKDWHADWLTGVAEAALSIVVGSAIGNRMTVSAPKMQLTNVQDANRDGVVTDALEFQCNRNAAAGDDEISFTFD